MPPISHRKVRPDRLRAPLPRRGSSDHLRDVPASLVSGRLEPMDTIEMGRLDVEGDPDAMTGAGEIFSLLPE